MVVLHDSSYRKCLFSTPHPSFASQNPLSHRGEGLKVRNFHTEKHFDICKKSDEIILADIAV